VQQRPTLDNDIFILVVYNPNFAKLLQKNKFVEL